MSCFLLTSLSNGFSRDHKLNSVRREQSAKTEKSDARFHKWSQFFISEKARSTLNFLLVFGCIIARRLLFDRLMNNCCSFPTLLKIFRFWKIQQGQNESSMWCLYQCCLRPCATELGILSIEALHLISLLLNLLSCTRQFLVLYSQSLNRRRCPYLSAGIESSPMKVFQRTKCSL